MMWASQKYRNEKELNTNEKLYSVSSFIAINLLSKL